jgi:DNA sulfur modification protein DndB
MCTLERLASVFSTPETDFNPELRAQRVLNKGRIPALVRYLSENRGTYVLTSLAASVDGELDFVAHAGSRGAIRTGELRVPCGARFLINDGQHRLAALRSALKQNPALGTEAISIVVYADAGLARSQQMFADLNRYAVRPTRSLNILYDHRDPIASLARRLSESVPMFVGLTETAANTISNRTRKLFTLNAIYQATQRLLGRTPSEELTERDERLAEAFWTELGSNMPDWQDAAAGKKHPSDLRRDYVHAHGIALHALGVVGNSLLLNSRTSWRKRLVPLRTMDWCRSSVNIWEGRAMSGGRMCKAGHHVTLTANRLKAVLSLPLTPAETAVERTHETARSPVVDRPEASHANGRQAGGVALDDRRALHGRRETVGHRI